MLINGEKWACETCIKGHRATHCKHTDRKLIVIKKKGRPSTQCKRCRELRVVRQLHVKCDCEDQESDRGTKKKKELSSSNSSSAIKKKIKIDVLRPIAPKQENTTPPAPILPIATTISSSSSTPSPFISNSSNSSCCSGKKAKEQQQQQQQQDNKLPSIQRASVTQSSISCCSSSSSATTTTTATSSTSSTIPIPIESVPLPNIPPPSSCCGPPSKNQQGETIRVVTCRCGDSCACIGCDAHPSRAMKEGINNDVYIGFDNNKNSSNSNEAGYQLSHIIGNNRKLSISAICAANSNSNNTPLPPLPPLVSKSYSNSNQQETTTDHPTSILSEDGILLCGCGCQKTFEDCSDCFRELCQNF